MTMYRWNGDVLTEWKQLQDKMDVTKKEWESFMKTGKLVPDSKIAPEILSSWRRSKDRGISPYDDNIPILSQMELKSRLDANKKMIEIIRPILQETASSIQDSGFQLDLYDKDLYLLMRFGKKIHDGDYERRIIIPGESHRESDVGTTATSLAAILERPMQLAAYEHYKTMFHNLTCSSVPILNQAGKLSAVLTVEGNCWPMHKHTLGLLIALKYSIEYRLSKNTAANNELRWSFSREAIEMLHDPSVIVDSSGKIIAANQKADCTINKGWKSVIGFSCETVWGQRNPFLEVIKSGKPIVNRGVVLDVDASPMRFTGTIKPVFNEDDKFLGAIGIFKDSDVSRNYIKENYNLKAHYTFENIIGESPEIKQAIRLAAETAGMDSNILVLGESGTGKELFAQSIHNASPYAGGPFVAVNCSAIPHTLLESELFGYEGGAFTGAKKEGALGKFELAVGGTIFLDEINSMSLDMQAKILRVLQNKTIVRLGGSSEIPVNVRIIAASNVDLWQMVKREEFREDLYYRINVICIHIPPLRERVGDMDLLIDNLLLKLEHQLKQTVSIEQDAREMLRQYSWPGNVRELENVLERSWVLARTSNLKKITLEEVKSYRGIQEVVLSGIGESGEVGGKKYTGASAEKGTGRDGAGGGGVESPVKEKRRMEEVEQEAICKALEEYRGSVQKTAGALGIGRNTLYRKLKKYDIDIAEYKKKG